MAVNVEKRYELIFAEHHYASDFRVKIIQGWCVVYAALAAAFVWVQSAAQPLSWIITAAAGVVALLMWLADIRNRKALGVSKDVGAAIENDAAAGIDEGQRFFVNLAPKTLLEKASHSFVIDWFAGVMLVCFVAATIWLFYTGGRLPQSSAPVSKPVVSERP